MDEKCIGLMKRGDKVAAKASFGNGLEEIVGAHLLFPAAQTRFNLNTLFGMHT